MKHHLFLVYSFFFEYNKKKILACVLRRAKRVRRSIFVPPAPLTVAMSGRKNE